MINDHESQIQDNEVNSYQSENEGEDSDKSIDDKSEENDVDVDVDSDFDQSEFSEDDNDTENEWQIRKKRMRFIKNVSHMVRMNEYLELEETCSYRNMKIIHKTKHGFQTNSKYMTRYLDNDNFLQKLISAIMNIYHKYVCVDAKKRKYIIKYQTKVVINQIILNYHCVVGKNKKLINWLIRCKMWGIIDLINRLTPICSNDFSYRIALDNMIELEKINVLTKIGTKNLFMYHKCDQIIQHIKDNNLYTNTFVSLTDTNRIKDIGVIKFLCDENMIAVTRKAIRYYHEKKNFLLLNHLIENNMIKILNADINTIFKPKPKQKKLRRRVSRRVSRRVMEFNVSKSPKTQAVDFGKYMELTYARGHNIKINRTTKDILFSNGMYTTILMLINKESCSVEFDKYEKMLLFKFCTLTDDIETVKSLIDKKILMINEMHQNVKYLAQSIQNNAKNITMYMTNELKIKGIGLTIYMIMPRCGFKCIDDLFDRLKLMKDVDVLSNDIMKTIIYDKRITKTNDPVVIHKLIDDYGCVITKDDLFPLKRYKFDDFMKFTENVTYDKKRFIKKCIKYDGLGKNQNLPFELFKKLPDKNKQVVKFGLYALNLDNHAFFKKLINKFGFCVDLEAFRNAEMIKNPGFKINGFCFLEAVISCSKDSQKTIDEIKRVFTIDEIEKLLSTPSYGIINNKNYLPLIEKLGLQLSNNFLRGCVKHINDFMYYRNNIYSDAENVVYHLIEYIIKTNNGHSCSDSKYMEEVVGILTTCESMKFTNILLKLHDSEHNYLKYISTQIVHRIITNIFRTDRFAIEFNVLFKFITMVHCIDPSVLTPYIYTLINLGHKRYYNPPAWGYCQSMNKITLKQFWQLLQLKGQITESDFQDIVKVCGASYGQVEKLKKYPIVFLDNYLPDISELSDDITVFINKRKNGDQVPELDQDPELDQYLELDQDPELYFDMGPRNRHNRPITLAEEIDQALFAAAINENDENGQNEDNDHDTMDSELVPDAKNPGSESESESESESVMDDDQLDQYVNEMMDEIENEELININNK
jgi:hypothetical protein